MVHSNWSTLCFSTRLKTNACNPFDFLNGVFCCEWIKCLSTDVILPKNKYYNACMPWNPTRIYIKLISMGQIEVRSQKSNRWSTAVAYWRSPGNARFISLLFLSVCDLPISQPGDSRRKTVFDLYNDCGGLHWLQRGCQNWEALWFWASGMCWARNTSWTIINTEKQHLQ